MLADNLIHLAGFEILETRPAEIGVGPALVALAVVAFGEDVALDRLFERGGLLLFEQLQVIEPAEEEQVGDLLNHLKRVRNAARPERIPDAVDLIA